MTVALPRLTRRERSPWWAVEPPRTIGELPQRVNLALQQGDDRWFTIFVYGRDGVPYDLAGATPLSQIRAQPSDETPMASFAATVRYESVIVLHLTHAEATMLVPWRAVWDCQITQAGEVSTLCAGTVLIAPEVTR